MRLTHIHRRHMDQTAAGIHALNAQPAPDLIAFSPAHSLIQFGDNVWDQQQRTESPKKTLAARDEPKDSEVNHPEPSRSRSPIVHITPSVQEGPRSNGRQATQAPKNVRFQLHDNQHEEVSRDRNSPVIMESDDGDLSSAGPSTSSKRKRSKSAVAPRKANMPKQTKLSGKGSLQNSAGVLDRFKVGDLDAESEDEKEADVTIPASSKKNHTPAVHTSARELSLTGSSDGVVVDTQDDGRRKSQRARKPKDFGDVEIHGWKPKRLRKY